MIHPAFAHFAVVLPMLALLFGFYYLARQNEQLSRISTRLVVFGFIMVAIAWKSGLNDGRDAAVLLAGEGAALLELHRNVGTALLALLGAAALLKSIGCFKKHLGFEALAVFFLTFAAGLSLYQAVLGGSLVFDYGIGVEPTALVH